MTSAIVKRPTALTRGTSRLSTHRRSTDSGTRVEYLAFRLVDELYALPIMSIKEILKAPLLTEVPRAPYDVVGVISVRGRIITVRDLRRKLNLLEHEPTNKTRILLAEIALEDNAVSERIGLLVDEVLNVYRLTESQIESTQSAFGTDTTDYVAGIGRIDNKVIVLLDIKQILGFGRSQTST